MQDLKQKQKFPRISESKSMKKFSFTKYGPSRYFYQVLWQFLRSRRSRSNFGGLAVAAFGGEMRSD